MLCLRCTRRLACSLPWPRYQSHALPKSLPSKRSVFLPSPAQRSKPHLIHLSNFRTYTTLPLTRPRILSSPTSLTSSKTSPTLDLLPKISTHPSLLATQLRNGPRNTYDPSHRVRKRRHGFLSRKKSRTGRATLVRRRQKRRSTLSH